MTLFCPCFGAILHVFHRSTYKIVDIHRAHKISWVVWKKELTSCIRCTRNQIFFLFESNFSPQTSKKFEKHTVLIRIKDIILKKDPNRKIIMYQQYVDRPEVIDGTVANKRDNENHWKRLVQWSKSNWVWLKRRGKSLIIASIII